MNIIIPMAGMGKRMRPHTLTVPKPLFKIGGKSIVERLIEDLVNAFDDKIDNIGFVIGSFGVETENYLLDLAKKYNAKGHIYYQKEALGTAHAVYMAKEILEGNSVIAFADTLFSISKKIANKKDNIIWCYEVEDPSAYGVVKENTDGVITEFIEKPKEYVSNKAIIGIYYFEDGTKLLNELDTIIKNDIRVGNEFQLTTALENLKNTNNIFRSYSVGGWYDCGNKKETLKTNQAILTNVGSSINKSSLQNNTVVIDPVYIGEKVVLNNCIIGPYVSIHDNCTVDNSIIESSIVNNDTKIAESNISSSIIGAYASIKGKKDEFNLSDYSQKE